MSETLEAISQPSRDIDKIIREMGSAVIDSELECPVTIRFDTERRGFTFVDGHGFIEIDESIKEVWEHGRDAARQIPIKGEDDE